MHLQIQMVPFIFLIFLSLKKDTVSTSVVEKDIFIGNLSDLWKIERKTAGNNFIEPQYLRIDEDTITYYTYDSIADILRIESHYEFPFQINDEWGIGQFFGTYKVEEDEISSSLYGEDYGNGYLLQRKANQGLGFAIYEQVLLVEDIGVVWRNFEYRSGGTPITHEIYRLIDYHIE